MIQSIIMKNVASHNEVKLEPLKKINLIYGLNGAGKTILS
ncbi:AAA family ATPase, partial [Helicobacter sp. UBA3407]